MPTYDYICDACQHEFEAYESIKADSQTVCPTCHEPKLRRKIGAGAAILFKGSGFYQTDYRSDSYKKGAAADKTSSEAASKPAESSSPAPAAAPAPKPLDGRDLDMIRVKCPICAKSFEIAQLGDLPSFPFCTDRCRMVDLGRWIDGDYAIPSGKAGPEPTPEDDDEAEKDD